MNFRRFNHYICALTLAAVCTVSTMAATVNDVASNHWAYASVMDLANKGIMVPTSQGEFKPNQLMNHFEIADVMAKATGYVDVDVATNVDEAFKTQVQQNYEKQKPTLATYAAKFTSWDKSYDKQVAYLLGRGYLSTSDLEKFITKNGQTETKNIMTKEELAVLMVRMLAKEQTAKDTYKQGAFTDESSITESYRPHMAYLKTLGLINPDASGKVNPKTQVSKALCAQMISTTLAKKEGTTTDGNTSSSTVILTDELVTFKRVTTKSETEYYVSLTRGTNSSYYSLKKTTKVTDASGKEIAITDVPADAVAKVTVVKEGSTEYITKMQLTTTSSDTSSNTGTVLTGTIEGSVNNDVMRVAGADGTVKTYLLQDGCQITLNGTTVTADKLSAGNGVTITVSGTNSITKIVATTSTSSIQTDSELVAKKVIASGYVLTLKKNSVESVVTVPDSATIKRNNKTVSIQDLRSGDTIKMTQTGGVVTAVEATGVRQTVTGTIKEIHLAQTPRIVVSTGTEEVTYAFASDAALYDSNDGKSVEVRDLHLGQSVSIILDSKEIISLDVEKNTTQTKVIATIDDISMNNEVLFVILERDPVTNESNVYKRITLTDDVQIVLDGKAQNKNALKKNMQVVMTYKYMDDTTPQKIQII